MVKEDVGSYKVAIVDLDRMKTSTRSILQMFPDRESVTNCWYFSLLYMLLLETLPSEFLFPLYADKVISKQDDDVDSKVSALFTSVFKELSAIISDYKKGK